MRRFTTLLIVLFICMATSFSQKPIVLWQYLQTNKFDEFVGDDFENIYRSICPTTDSNAYLAVGNDKYSALVTKLDKSGAVLWNKRFDNHFLTRIKPTADGGCIVTGSISDAIFTNRAEDVLIMKLDKNGNTEWENRFGGGSSDVGRDIELLQDSSFIIVAYTQSDDGDVKDFHGNGDVLILKISKAGNLIWEKCLGGNNYEDGFTCQPLDGNSILIGALTSSTDGDLADITTENAQHSWLLKLDTSGKIIWQKVFERSGITFGFIDVKKDARGNYIALENTNDASLNNQHGDYDISLSYFSKDGDLLWQKCYGGSGYDEGDDIEINDKGEYIVCGGSASSDGDLTENHGRQDAWLLNVSIDGNINWQQSYGSSNTNSLIKSSSLSGNNIVTAGQINTIKYTNTLIRTSGWVANFGYGNSIMGFAYLDKNGNNIKDEDEQGFDGLYATISKGDDTTKLVSNNGYFNLAVDTGTYFTSVHTLSDLYNVTSEEKQSVFTDYQHIDSFSFVVHPTSLQPDLQVSLIPLDIARPGTPNLYKLSYTNGGTQDVNDATIKFIYDKRTSFEGSSPTPDFYDDTSVVWQHVNIESLDTNFITIELALGIPPKLNLGETLEHKVSITPSYAYPGNNAYTLRQVVYGSFDPNDKSESHAGKITEENIAAGDYLTYTIRFQNTGDDTAFNIAIHDTLSNMLDWSTLQMVDASHNYQLTITDGNKCVWKFNNILLPDSNVNEEGSNGYITYRIKAKTTQQENDIIKNTASIYFDYNLPVQTNTEETIVTSVTLPVKLLYFKATNKNGFNLLQWSTAQEINSDHFEIEHCNDSRSFSTLSLVKAAGNSTQKTDYSFIHLKPAFGKNYYRLKMVDKDGKATYSDIKIVINEGVFEVSLKGNPVKENMLLYFNSSNNCVASIEFVNAEGKIVLRKKINIAAGVSTQTITTNSLPAGNYFLRCINGSMQSRFKVVKTN